MTLSSLTFIAACGLLAWLIWRAAGAKGKGVGAWTLATAAGVPAALIVLCLCYAAATGKLGELRLTLLGVEARLERGVAFTVGGDKACNDMVVAGAAEAAAPARAGACGEALLSFRRASDDPAGSVLDVDVRTPQPGETPLLVGSGRKQKLTFEGQQVFAEGDAVCLSNCSGSKARWFVLSGQMLRPAVLRDGRWVADADAAPGRRMLSRPVLRLIEGVDFWRANQAIHPLRDHLPPAAGATGPGLCGSRYFCVPVNGRATAAGSFLFREGGLFRGAWRLVLLDPGARYAPRSEASAAQAAKLEPRPMANGEARAFSIWEIRYGATEPTDESNLSRLVERRSFVAANRPDRLAISLDSPETQVIGGCTGGTLTAAEMIGDPEVSPQGAVALRALGGLSARAANGFLPLPRENCESFKSAAVTLGDLEHEARAASARLDAIAFPWPMAIIAVLWAVVAWLVQRQVWSEHRLAFTLVAVLQLLLAVRWLIAFSGVALEPGLDWREILRADGVAYIVCPSLLLLWSGADRRLFQPWLLLGVFVTGALAALFAWLGAPLRPSLTVGLIGGFYLALATVLLLAWRPKLLSGIPRLVGKGLSAIRDRTPSLPAWAWWLGAAFLLRFGLGLLGFKERIGLAVSALYTPLLIFGFAALFDDARRAAGQARSRLWVAYLLLLLLLVLVLPFLVHDVGYALVLAPLVMLPAGYVLSSGPRAYPPRDRTLWIAPAAIVAAALVLFPAAGPVVSMVTPGLSDADLRAAVRADDDRAAIEILDRQADLDQNVLRLLAVVMPRQVAATGTSQAENLAAWSGHLAAYTSETFGRGYMAPSRLNAILRPVHMDDNVSAVHVMSPFGRAGGAALLMLLAALPLACARLTTPRTGAVNRSRAEIAGLLALWLMFGVAAYVILANLQLVPFTGRNVYLLAAKSGSDMVEGLSLFAIAFWGLSRARGKA